MIEVLYAATPNGWKISIMLEECGLPYRVTPISLSKGEQFSEAFLKVAPNNKIPAIIDHAPEGGGPPVPVFETGAILLYLAEKSGRFLPDGLAERYAAIQWVFWQTSGLGPMLGQHGHFFLYAKETIPYAIDRFRGETKRLYKVLDTQLGNTGAYVAGPDLTVADFACFPWIVTHKAQKLSLDDYPQIKRWFTELRGREALQRGMALGGGLKRGSDEDREARDRMFGIGSGKDEEYEKRVNGAT